MARLSADGKSVVFNEAETGQALFSTTEKFILIWLAVLLGVGGVLF